MRRLLTVCGMILAGFCGCNDSGGFDLGATLGLDNLTQQSISRTEAAQRFEDRDEDGLLDFDEDAIGSDRANPDTDEDGVSDALELVLATDPTSPDFTETVDDVPAAFDGIIRPGESRMFFRGAASPVNGYLRLFGLVRESTRVRLTWQQTDDQRELVTLAETTIEFLPRSVWCWGHDIGGSAVITDPVPMTVERIIVEVLDGDSVAYNFLSSGGASNGPRGFVDMPEALIDAELDFTLLLAHGLEDISPSWDGFVFMIERISDETMILRTDVDPAGTLRDRADELAGYLVREAMPGDEVHAIGHSMGGLDLRYIATQAAMGDADYVDAASLIRAIYTIGTPHRGALLSNAASTLPRLAELVDLNAPAVIDLQPDSDAITALNDAFDGDITIGDRVVPVISLAFSAGEPTFAASDGVVELASQVFGQHTISDIPSTRGAGPGAGKHVPFIPTRADVELHSYEVLGRILTDIVERRSNVGGEDDDDGDGAPSMN